MLRRELLITRAERSLNEKYRDYIPNGKCAEFIDQVGSGKTFISLFSAANGVGKTAAGVNILAHMMWPCNSPWFQQPLYKTFPFQKKGRIISDPNTIKKTISEQLKQWFPKGKYTTNKNGKDYESMWKTDTGYEFDLMTYEQDPKEFESSNLGWAWFDEPPPEAIFKATVARMRRGGIIFITATPLTGSAWMYDQIITNPLIGQREYVEADVEANCRQHGIRGILEHEHIEKMVSEYSEDDKQARIYGKFQHLTGLVMKKWNRKVHVIDPFEVTKESFVVVSMLDPHPRTPDAALWLAADKYGRKYVVDEFFESFTTTASLRERIKKIDEQYRIVGHYADPSIFNENQHMIAFKTLAQNLDLGYLPASKQRAMAIKRTQAALNYQEQLGTLIVPPELYVFSTCQRTIFEAEHWQWSEYTGKTADRRGQSEKPQDKDDHMMENLGRALLLELTWQPLDNPIHQREVYIEPNYDPIL